MARTRFVMLMVLLVVVLLSVLLSVLVVSLNPLHDYADEDSERQPQQVLRGGARQERMRRIQDLPRDPGKPLVLTLCDQHFHLIILDFYENAIQRWNIPNFVCIAYEEESYWFFQRFSMPVYLFPVVIPGSNNTSYLSSAYYLKMLARLELMNRLVEMGHDVLYTDSDIVFAKNPLENLNLRDRDLVAARDDQLFNCGFMFIRASPIMKIVLQKSYERARELKLHDQIAINDILLKQRGVKKTRLPIMKFQSGRIYYSVKCRKFFEDRKCNLCVIIHNNFIMGYHKKIYRNRELLLFHYDGQEKYYSGQRRYFSFEMPPHSTYDTQENAIKAMLTAAIETNSVVVFPRFGCFDCNRTTLDFERVICECGTRQCIYSHNWDVEILMTSAQCGSRFRESAFPFHPLVPPVLQSAYQEAIKSPVYSDYQVLLLKSSLQSSTQWIHFVFRGSSIPSVELSCVVKLPEAKIELPVP